MRRAVCAVYVVAGLLGCAEAEDGAPRLAFDTLAACAEGSSCIHAGVETYDVDGVRVLHKRLPGHPLVTVMVLFDGASSGGKQAWSESLAFSLLERSGSSRFTSSAWDAQLLHLGASVRANAATDYGWVAGLAPLPRWREVWELIGISLYDPNINDYDLDNARDYFQRDFTSERDDPARAASLDAFSRLFQGDVPTLRRETQPALASVTTGDLAAAWRGLLHESRMLVTLVGDVDRSDVESAVQSLSAAAYPESASEFPVDARRPFASSRAIKVLPYPDAPTWHINAFFRGPLASSPDYAALSLGLEVLDARLFREIRDARGLAYTTGAAPAFYRQSYGHVWLSTHAPQEALPIARQLIADLETQGPAPSELAAARESIRTRMLSNSDGPWGLAFTLADWQLTAGSSEALDEYFDTLERAQPETVAAVLDTYLRDVQISAAGGGSPLTDSDLSTLFVRP